jgi:uncharacterized RDD family membrane protein YckC
VTCPSCRRRAAPGRQFCVWCETFLRAPRAGGKASVARRFWANCLDMIVPFLGMMAVGMILGAADSATADAGTLVFGFLMLLAWAGYVVGAVVLFASGRTPGKLLAGVRVVDGRTGRPAGFWRMLGREWPGKVASNAFLGLGYFWAIVDKDNQAWHDKIFSTVVTAGPPRAVSARRPRVAPAAPPPARRALPASPSMRPVNPGDLQRRPSRERAPRWGTYQDGWPRR